jgi:thymidylate kinase
MLVIVEGADGVGKTTVIKELREHSEIYFNSTPFFSSGTFSPDLKSKIIEAQAAGNLLEKNTLFIKALTYTLTTALEFIENDTPVVLDRFIQTYYAYQIRSTPLGDPNLPDHLIASFNQLQNRLNKLAEETRVVYIYLHADPSVTYHRLNNRSTKVDVLDDYYLTNQAGILLSYLEYFKATPIMQKYKISTDKPLECVMKQIRQALL